MPRGRLRWNPALARKAEPCRCTMSAKLGRAQLDDFKSWFDGQNHLARRPARRTHLPQRSFGRADQAQPQGSGLEHGCDPFSKLRTLLGFVEDMKAAAVKDEPEGTAFRSTGQNVQGGEAARQSATIYFFLGPFDRARSDVDTQYVESVLRKVNRIRPRPRSNVERPRRLNPARRDELNQQRLRLPRVPRQLSRGVAFIPVTMRHIPSVAPLSEQSYTGASH